jgi:hypothetical protein
MAIPTRQRRAPARRVDDAVARHGNHRPCAEALDNRGLLVRQHIRLDFIDAELSGDGFGRGAIVAGQHDDADTFRMQCL